MRKYVAFLLAVCFLLAIPAYAVSDSTQNFVRTKTYTGQFSDLSETSVFYSNVSALYEYGLSIGKVDGTYGLTDSLTVGQAVIFAGRIRSLYRTGAPETGPAAYASADQPTAAPYLKYLQAEGVLDTSLDDSLLSVATRAQMAQILANLLPEEALPAVHTELVTSCYTSGRFIPDVTKETPYYQDILALYHRGISIGSDAVGHFYPDAPITRGAVAAMLTRIIDPALRVTPQWDLAAARSAKGTTLADLIPSGTYAASPATAEELNGTLRYMLASGDNTLSLRYPSLTEAQVTDLLNNALAYVKTFCEQSYNQVSCTFTLEGELSMTFSAAGAESIPDYRPAAMDAAIAVHDQLWNEGLLREGMTQWEMAHVYYTWICENCTYDHSASDNSVSHIPYGLFQNGTAVCDGYTGAYNLLLKLEGIDCSVYMQEDHIWTTATLDGTEYHIDTTWGDMNDNISYLYFGMTPELSLLYHR